MEMAAVLGLLLGNPASGASRVWDFERDPSIGPDLRVGQANNPAVWFPTHGNPGGFLGLTWPVANCATTVVFPDLENGATWDGFRFECDLRIGNSTGDRPADGFSISFARPWDPVIASANPEAPWRFASGLSEAGTTTGLVISFDTWSGNGLPDGGDIEGIIVRHENRTLARVSCPIRHGDCRDPLSLQTGPQDPFYWSSGLPPTDPAASVQLCWQPLVINLSSTRQLTVLWKGMIMLQLVLPQFEPSPRRLVLAGRTGGANQHVHLDNLRVTVNTVSAPARPIGSPTGLTVVEAGARRVLLAWREPAWPADPSLAPLVYEVSRNGSVVAPPVSGSQLEDRGLTPSTRYTYTLRSRDSRGHYSPPVTLVAETVAEELGTGFVRADVFQGFPGSDQAALDQVLAEPRFLATPDQTLLLDGLSFGGPRFGDSLGENLSVRLAAVVTPPETGDYRFFLRSDDASRLHLNPVGEAIPSPSSQPIAREDGCCRLFQEPNDAAPPGVTSRPFRLEKGRRYGLLFLVKEGGGGDWGEVAWRREGDATPAAQLTPIRGSSLLAPVDGVGASLEILSHPANTSVPVGRAVTFTIRTTSSSPYVSQPSFQWFRNGLPIPGANLSSYTLPVTRSADQGARFQCLAFVPGADAFSREATLSIGPSAPPRIREVSSDDAFTRLDIRFDQPVTRVSAESVANYQVQTGVTVLGATLLDPATVRLTTSRLNEDAPYRVLVNNLRNFSGQSIAPNSSRTFTTWSLQPGRVRADQHLGLPGADQAALDSFIASERWGTEGQIVRNLGGMSFGEPSFLDTWGDEYVVTLRTVLRPSVSGRYRLFTRSDDASRLYFNPFGPAIPDPRSSEAITREDTCCQPFLEPSFVGTGPTSEPFELVAGRAYGLLFVVKEGGGSDFGQVALRREGVGPAAALLSPLSDLVAWYGPSSGTLAPAADRIEVAPLITLSPSGSAPINNSGATKDPGEPRHAGRLGGASIWYHWRPLTDGVVTLSLLSSNFDAVLAVYTNATPGTPPSLGSLVEITSNDDLLTLTNNRVVASSSRAEVTFSFRSGTTYFIAIDGVNASSGSGILSWSITPEFGHPEPRLQFSRNPSTPSVLPSQPVFLHAEVIPDGVTPNIERFEWYFNGVLLNTNSQPTISLGPARGEIVGTYHLRYTRFLETAGAATTRIVFAGPFSLQMNLGGEPDVFVEDKLEFPPEGASSPLQLLGRRGRHTFGTTVAGAPARGFSGAHVSGSHEAGRQPGEPAHCGIGPYQSTWLHYKPRARGTLEVRTTALPTGVVSAAYGPDVVDVFLLERYRLGIPGDCARLTFPCESNMRYSIANDYLPNGQAHRITNAYTLHPEVIRDLHPSWSSSTGQGELRPLESAIFDPETLTHLADFQVVAASLTGPGSPISLAVVDRSIFLPAAIATTPGDYRVTYTVQKKTGVATISDRTEGLLDFQIAAPPSPATARFVGLDASSGGEWRGRYGSYRSQVIGDPSSSSSPLVSQGSSIFYDTADAHGALKHLNGSASRAACWYTETPSLFLSLTNPVAAPMLLSLYFADVDHGPRSQRISLFRKSDGLLLDSREVHDFYNGLYLTWEIDPSLELDLEILKLGSSANPVISGFFLDPLPSGAAKFRGVDAGSGGEWRGRYGALRRQIIGDRSPSLPLWVDRGAISSIPFGVDPSHPAALANPNGSSPEPACWWTPSSMSFRIGNPDPSPRLLSLYFTDLNAAGRAQRISLYRANTLPPQLLDQREIRSFADGLYLTWEIDPSLQLDVSIENLSPAPANAVISGFFLDPIRALLGASTSPFVHVPLTLTSLPSLNRVSVNAWTSDPLPPPALILRRVGSEFMLDLGSPPGAGWELQRSDDLSIWVPVEILPDASAGQIHLERSGPDLAPAQFFRLVRSPAGAPP